MRLLKGTFCFILQETWLLWEFPLVSLFCYHSFLFISLFANRALNYKLLSRLRVYSSNRHGPLFRAETFSPASFLASLNLKPHKRLSSGWITDLVSPSSRVFRIVVIQSGFIFRGRDWVLRPRCTGVLCLVLIGDRHYYLVVSTGARYCMWYRL